MITFVLRATRLVSTAARLRQSKQAARKQSSLDSPVAGIAEPVNGEPGDWLKVESRIWWSPANLWRHDMVLPDGSAIVALIRDDVSLRFMAAQQTVYTSSDEPGRAQEARASRRREILAEAQRVPVVPYALDEAEWILRVEDTIFLGRAARKVSATRRVGERLRTSGKTSEPSAKPWIQVNTCETIEDRSVGILLAYFGRSDDEVVERFVVEELHVIDGEVPDVFQFVPPPLTKHVGNCQF
jgi:hypothetical protein